VNTKIALLIVAAASSMCGSAFGSLIERTAQLDLSALILPTSHLQTVVAISPFSADVGDTFVFHLEFLGGRLAIKDSVAAANDYIGLQFISNPIAQTGFLYAGTWHFNDVVGDLLANDFSLGYGGPLGGFTANKNLTDTSFSISGITYTINITYKEPGRPAFTSDTVELRAYTGGSPSDAISIQTVPEPATAILAAIGLAGTAVSRARRRFTCAHTNREPLLTAA
jgi:PEP-CTERM motif